MYGKPIVTLFKIRVQFQVNFNLMKFNFNSMKFQFQLNFIELKLNFIELKLNFIELNFRCVENEDPKTKPKDRRPKTLWSKMKTH